MLNEIDKAIMEIAKCEEKDMKFLFAHKNQHWILERIQFFLEGEE
tara:strand:- start:1010 stop:1144 length:135 start_codon:yes stop_codon:yes gene_type:complete